MRRLCGDRHIKIIWWTPHIQVLWRPQHNDLFHFMFSTCMWHKSASVHLKHVFSDHKCTKYQYHTDQLILHTFNSILLCKTLSYKRTLIEIICKIVFSYINCTTSTFEITVDPTQLHIEIAFHLFNHIFKLNKYQHCQRHVSHR